MKRPFAHRLFSAWLALLVLTASVGLTVQRHACYLSGQQTVSVVLAPQHRCPAPAGVSPVQSTAALVKKASSCCEFHAQQHKLSAHAAPGALKSLLPPLLLGLPASSCWAAAAFPTKVAVASAPGVYAASFPPPRAGRALLIFVGTLVV
ncbi:hypothetical protein LJY25_19650 [Hymenobacter sp. BT175]|uniref:hypothetical protein n=1 Tax=Hymenobacter translucens TaxID=2886507 RepID=UPI001D0E9B67|nr:hypothetical protein [Hymenobacter translucens]MCC2548673.1 hypothetical protein [Hymenobacter translucens]